MMGRDGKWIGRVGWKNGEEGEEIGQGERVQKIESILEKIRTHRGFKSLPRYTMVKHSYTVV